LDAREDAEVVLVFENIAQQPHLRMVLERADQAELSPDGATLALRTKDAVRVVRVPSGGVLLDTRGTGFGFWPDGSKLVVDLPLEPRGAEHAVYDLRSGDKLAEFSGSYAFRDASLVALGGWYPTQFLRDAPVGPMVYTLEEADHVAFRPDGARLAHCKLDGRKVTFLDVRTEKVVAESSLPFGCQGALAWTRDGRSLAVARGAEQVALLDGETGRVLSARNGPEDEGTSRIAFTPDGSWLCAAFAVLEECHWKLQGRKLVPSERKNAMLGDQTAILVPMSQHARMAQGDARIDGDGPIIALSHDGKLVAELEDLPVGTARTLTHLAIYDAATRRRLRSVALFPSSGEPDLRQNALVEFSEDNRRVHVQVGGGTRFVDIEDGRVLADATDAVLWGDPRSLLGEGAILDLASGARRELAPERPLVPVRHLRASGQLVAGVSSGLRAQDWRTGSAFVIRGALDQSALSDDGRWLAFRQPSRLLVQDLRSRSTVFSHADTSQGPVAISAGHVATLGIHDVSRKGVVRLQRWPSGAIANTLEMTVFDSSVSALGFDPSGATLVASARYHGCEAWDVNTGARLWANQRWPIGAAASFARDLVLLGPWLVQTRTGRLIARFDGIEPDQVSATALQADGNLAAVALKDAVRVYDVKSRGLLASIPGRAYALAFDGTSGRLVVGDGQVRVYDAVTGQVVLAVALASNGAVAFDPEGEVELLGPDPSSLRRYLACTVGSIAVPFAACEERLLRVGLMARLQSGAPHRSS
jgi:WD40 repeat protein